MFSSPSLASARSLRLSAVSLTFVILCLLLLAPRLDAQEVVSVSGSRSPVERRPAPEQEPSIREKAARGQAPLSRLYDHIRVNTETIHRLPALPAAERETEGLKKRVRIGAVRAFPQPLDAASDSSLYSVPDGEVRVMGAASEGAVSIRVHFTGMALPVGARLFVYSMKNRDEIYGPYEGRGPNDDGAFWTPPLEGDAAVIELFTPTPNTSRGNSYFQIPEVSHVFTNPLTGETDAAGGEMDTAGSCNLNVTAPYVNSAKAVGELQFTEPDGEYICTGTLLNTQTSDFTPYLITAHHCFSTQSAAQSLRVYWNYNSGDFPPAGTPRTDGSNLLKTGSASDYTFVRLTGSVPGGLWFTGWTTAMPAAETAITGIHHPSGSHKRISFGTVSSEPGCPFGITCANFIRVNWSSGVTEGGSSGSELLVGPASNPQYVGNLWGGASSCSAPTDPDWYGRFDVTYPNISSYLAGTVPTRILTVTSANPTSGVTITVSPADRDGHAGSTTQFSRIYNHNTDVTLTAIPVVAGNLFQKWQRNGVDWATTQTTTVTMDAAYTMKAVYSAGPSDTSPPSLNITSHSNGQTVSTASIILSGTATDSGHGNNGIVSVTVNGARATGDTATGAGTANWSRTVSLAQGANTITVITKDGRQNARQLAVTITRTTAVVTYNIDGTVKLGTQGLSGVTLTLTGGTGFTPRTFNTTATGAYTFGSLPAGRNYLVKPSKLGNGFTPASRAFNNLSANQTPATASFNAVLKNYRSSVVKPITDLGTVDVPLVITDIGTITDLNVRIRLNHTLDSDLDIYLIGPDGTTVELTTDNGGAGANYGSGANSCASTPTVFDSAAPGPITTAIAPFAGKFRPEQSLSIFNGKSSRGTWKLRIIDDKGGDVGTLYCWELQFNQP